MIRYTKRDSKKILKQVARLRGISVSEIREELEIAIEEARNNPAPDTETEFYRLSETKHLLQKNFYVSQQTISDLRNGELAMKKSEEEQNIFLSICSAYDRAVLTGKEEMKKEDFERITHITMALGFIPYTQLICSQHMDLAVELEEHEERERKIYLEYPEYYDDEEIYEKYDKWIEDFLLSDTKGQAGILSYTYQRE